MIGNKPSDVKGRRWTLLWNNSWFIVGGIMCSFSNIYTLFLGRFILGERFVFTTIELCYTDHRGYRYRSWNSWDCSSCLIEWNCDYRESWDHHHCASGINIMYHIILALTKINPFVMTVGFNIWNFHGVYDWIWSRHICQPWLAIRTSKWNSHFCFGTFLFHFDNYRHWLSSHL